MNVWFYMSYERKLRTVPTKWDSLSHVNKAKEYFSFTILYSIVEKTMKKPRKTELTWQLACEFLKHRSLFTATANKIRLISKYWRRVVENESEVLFVEDRKIIS